MRDRHAPRLRTHGAVIPNGSRLDRVLLWAVRRVGGALGHDRVVSTASNIEVRLANLLGLGLPHGAGLDAEVNAAIATISNPDPVVFDIGARCGEWSLQLRRSLPDARVYLFEPDPACREVIAAQEIPGMQLIPHAASSQPDKLRLLHVVRGAAGLSSLHTRRESWFDQPGFTTVPVQTVTVDHLMLVLELPSVDFMKIDVGGHEFEVLKGALAGLRNRAISAFSFEFGSASLNARIYFHDLWDLIHPLGYEVARILPTGRLLPIDSYSEGCEFFRGSANYLAALEGRLPRHLVVARDHSWSLQEGG